VFSQDTLKQLDVYGYLINQTKHKYSRMSENLNKLAMTAPKKAEKFANRGLAGKSFSDSMSFNSSVAEGLHRRSVKSETQYESD